MHIRIILHHVFTKIRIILYHMVTNAVQFIRFKTRICILIGPQKFGVEQYTWACGIDDIFPLSKQYMRTHSAITPYIFLTSLWHNFRITSGTIITNYPKMVMPLLWEIRDCPVMPWDIFWYLVKSTIVSYLKFSKPRGLNLIFRKIWFIHVTGLADTLRDLAIGHLIRCWSGTPETKVIK